jgi:hypothetical protein
MKNNWKNIKIASGMLVLRSPVLKRSFVRKGSFWEDAGLDEVTGFPHS